jgi:flavin-dependent dehydrogenase
MTVQLDEIASREAMEFDVVVAGAGPAGLATATRLKQRAAERGGDVSVVVVEKSSEVGTHILSGAVIDPIGLDRLSHEEGALGAWRFVQESRSATPVPGLARGKTQTEWS